VTSVGFAAPAEMISVIPGRALREPGIQGAVNAVRLYGFRVRRGAAPRNDDRFNFSTSSTYFGAAGALSGFASAGGLAGAAVQLL
jgi:hypothetical protein